MSEGRELACALHFQLEAAIQLVGAVGGCVLVARTVGETTRELAAAIGLATGVQAEALQSDVDIKSMLAAGGHDGSESEKGSATRTAKRMMKELDDEMHAGGKKDINRLVMQFRCVALSGRTAHRAFAHESMLTGVIESGIALNIALAAEPFLAMPLKHPNNVNEPIVGVLCLAYKANQELFQFDERDEGLAQIAAHTIAASIHRCPAMKFVEPYPLARLIPLGLNTSLPPVCAAVRGAADPRSTGGLVYRSSSRAALSKRIDGLATQEIPALGSLMEVSLVIRDLEQLLVRQQQEVDRQVDTQHKLEKRLRNVQQDFSSLRVTALKDKQEGDAFRLSGTMIQQALNERIAKSEVEKLHSNEKEQMKKSDEIHQFLASAMKVIHGDKVASLRGKPCAPVVIVPKAPSSAGRSISQRPSTGSTRK